MNCKHCRLFYNMYECMMICIIGVSIPSTRVLLLSILDTSYQHNIMHIILPNTRILGRYLPIVVILMILDTI